MQARKPPFEARHRQSGREFNELRQAHGLPEYNELSSSDRARFRWLIRKEQRIHRERYRQARRLLTVDELQDLLTPEELSRPEYSAALVELWMKQQERWHKMDGK